MDFLKRLFSPRAADPAANLQVTTRLVLAEHERHPTPTFVNRREAVPPDGVKLRGKGRVDVSGESHYESALAALTGGRTPSGVNVGVMAALVPEPANPHDPKAVAVQVGGATVGHLDRSNARAYQPVLDKLAAEGKTGFCNATIRGGWDRGASDRGGFGVTLELGPPGSALGVQ